MIEIIGSQESAEGIAAAHLVGSIAKLWPSVASSESEVLRAATGAKVFGSAAQDLDVVILLLAEDRIFQPLRPVPARPHGELITRDIRTASLLLTVEVKNHDPRSVRFDGNGAFVHYSDRWHSASEQSVQQAHALRHYLESSVGVRAFVCNLIYFPNLDESDLPPRPHNIIAGQIAGRTLLSAIADVARPYAVKPGHAVLSAGTTEAMRSVAKCGLFRSLLPSPLDRVRLERISRRLGMDERWLSDLGSKEIILRGRAGTGKTVALLQLANKLFEEQGARTLLLTYNLALLADIRRLIALLGIPAGGEHGGVRTESAMSFISSVLSKMRLLDSSAPLLEQYESAAHLLAQSLSCAAVSREELISAVKADERFQYDFVMVDEAQDWPMDEIQILRACVDSDHLVVADGMDQLVRGDRAAWTSGVAAAHQKIWPLKSALRLKSNLAHFANAMALELGLIGWHIEPRPEVSGGQVVIVIGKLPKQIRDRVLP